MDYLEGGKIPAWKHYADQLVKHGVPYWERISREQFCLKIGLDGVPKHHRDFLRVTSAMENFKNYLLLKYSVYLEWREGDLLIVPPEHQTAAVATKFVRKLSLAADQCHRGASNIQMDKLNDIQRRENMDLRARSSIVNSFAEKMYDTCDYIKRRAMLVTKWCDPDGVRPMLRDTRFDS